MNCSRQTGARRRNRLAVSFQRPNRVCVFLRSRIPLRLAAAGHGACRRNHRLRRQLVDRGGAAHGPAGVRRRARCRVAALHDRHDRLWPRRRADGPHRRPLHHRGVDRHRRYLPWPWLWGRQRLDIALAVHPRARADRTRRVGGFRAADGGRVALAHQAARPRRRGRRQRLLSRRRAGRTPRSAFSRRRRSFLFRCSSCRGRRRTCSMRRRRPSRTRAATSSCRRTGSRRCW